MKSGPWVIVALVLLVLSVIISVMDRSFLTPTYLAVLAIAVMVGSGESFRGRSTFPTFSGLGSARTLPNVCGYPD